MVLAGPEQEQRHAERDEDGGDVLVGLVLGAGDQLPHQHHRDHLTRLGQHLPGG